MGNRVVITPNLHPEAPSTSPADRRPVESATTASLSERTAPILKIRTPSAGLVSMSIENADKSASSRRETRAGRASSALVTAPRSTEVMDGLGALVANQFLGL